MRPALRHAAGALLAAAAVLALAALSRVPYTPAGADAAVLRLSWRLRGERVQACRPVPAEEQARMPAHMRRTEVCEGRVLPYLLEVRLDGRVVLHDTVHASGARQDRPLYVFHEVAVAPGPRRVSVRFTRLGGDAAAHATAAPAVLRLDEAPAIRPGEVFLVTYDDDRRVLAARRAGPRP